MRAGLEIDVIMRAPANLSGVPQKAPTKGSGVPASSSGCLPGTNLPMLVEQPVIDEVWFMQGIAMPDIKLP